MPPKVPSYLPRPLRRATPARPRVYPTPAANGPPTGAPAVSRASPARPVSAFRPAPTTAETGGIFTYTGRHISPLRLRTEDVCIEDIAHGLALMNRFVGQTPRPISVAQHSVYVSRLCESHGPRVALQALLHDASEAYLGDMSKWVKGMPEMEGFRKAEAQAQMTIYESFGLSCLEHESIEEADRLMVRYEAYASWGAKMPLFLRPRYPVPTKEECERVGMWRPWTWLISEESFLNQFNALVSDLEDR